MLIPAHDLAQPAAHPVAHHGGADPSRSDESGAKKRLILDLQNPQDQQPPT